MITRNSILLHVKLMVITLWKEIKYCYGIYNDKFNSTNVVVVVDNVTIMITIIWHLFKYIFKV